MKQLSELIEEILYLLKNGQIEIEEISKNLGESEESTKVAAGFLLKYGFL